MVSLTPVHGDWGH